MKRRIFFFAMLLATVGAGLWWFRFRPAPTTTHRPVANATTPIVPPAVSASPDPRPPVEYWAVSPLTLKALKSETYTTEMAQAIGRLNDPRYRREDVERALLPLLNHPNSKVRARACRTLAEQGSTLGHSTALAILSDAIKGQPLVPLSLDSALNTLVHYRTPIPKDLVIGLSQHFTESKDSGLRHELINYTYDELLPWWEDAIRNRQNGTFDYLFTFRRASPDIVERLHAQRPHATRPANHFRAEYKLYLIGQNPGFFPEILKMAEIHLGRRQRPPAPDFTYEIRWDTTHKAWKYILYSKEPAALDLLRSVATELSTDPNREVMHYQNALGALFYLHRDYAFVDKLLMDRLLACIDSIQKTRRNILTPYECQIMAVRGNPEFARLMNKHIPGLHYFVYYRDLPIERWISLPGRSPHPDTRVAIKGEP